MFDRPTDKAVLQFWNTKDKSSDNPCPARWSKTLQCSTLLQTTSFSVSSPLSVCFFVHGFLLFTVMPNTFMIIGGKVFCFIYLFFAAVSVLPFSLPNPGAHIWRAAHLFRRLYFQGLPLANTWQKGFKHQKNSCFQRYQRWLTLLWGGEVSSVFYCEIHCQYSQGITTQSPRFNWRILLHIQQKGFYPFEHCFQNGLYLSV